MNKLTIYETKLKQNVTFTTMVVARPFQKLKTINSGHRVQAIFFHRPFKMSKFGGHTEHLKYSIQPRLEKDPYDVHLKGAQPIIS